MKTAKRKDARKNVCSFNLFTRGRQWFVEVATYTDSEVLGPFDDHQDLMSELAFRAAGEDADCCPTCGANVFEDEPHPVVMA